MAADILIILGSASDKTVAEKAQKTLTALGISFETVIRSAHRTPAELHESVAQAEAAGTRVFIAIAGLAAALPGVVAAITTKPVIGVPVSGPVNFDAILAIVQMPPGIPVATVGLDNGQNAALLAAEILAVGDAALGARLTDYREAQRKKVLESTV